MANQTIAVVIPVFNRGRLVCEALDSIVRQTRWPDRVVVVNDGSTDDTSACIEAWRRSHNPPFAFDLLEQPSSGAAAARNAGLAQVADCDLVAFLDSDDLWPDDFLDRAARSLAGNAAAVAVSADRLVQCAASGSTRLESLAPLQTQAKRWFFENHGGVASCTLFRAAAILRCGAFPPAIRTGHDVALFFRVSRCGPWLHTSGQPVIARHGLAASRGQADHVCRQYSDYHRRWAQVWEQLAKEAHDCLPARLVRRVLAGRWYRAGRQLAAQNRWHEADACFSRAIDWQWSPKTVLRLFACRLQALRQRTSSPVRVPS